MSMIDPGKLRRAMTRPDPDRRLWHEWESPGREPGPATFHVVTPIAGATSGPAFDAVWLGVALAQHPNLDVKYTRGASIAQACTERDEVNTAQLRRLQRIIAAARSGRRETVLREATAIAKGFAPDGPRVLHGLRWVADVARALSGNAEQVHEVASRWARELQQPRSRSKRSDMLAELDEAAQDAPDEDVEQAADELKETLRGV